MTTTLDRIKDAKPGNGLRNRYWRRARMIYIVEGLFKGKTKDELADELGVDERTIRRELTKAGTDGVIERVRNRMLETLEKVPNVYDDILSADVETLHKQSRGYKLKLDAANALSTGNAVFRPESVKRTEYSLEAIAAERPKEWGNPVLEARAKRRLAYRSADVQDGELIEPDSPAYKALEAVNGDDAA